MCVRQNIRDKIKKSIAIHNASHGVINIPDIKIYIKALELTWLWELYQNISNGRSSLQATCPDSFQTYGPCMLTTKKGYNPFWDQCIRGL